MPGQCPHKGGSVPVPCPKERAARPKEVPKINSNPLHSPGQILGSARCRVAFRSLSKPCEGGLELPPALSSTCGTPLSQGHMSINSPRVFVNLSHSNDRASQYWRLLFDAPSFLERWVGYVSFPAACTMTQADSSTPSQNHLSTVLSLAAFCNHIFISTPILLYDKPSSV